MPTLRLADHLTLNYLDPSPDNPNPVLLLHGLGSDCSSWGCQIPPLIKASFRPLAPDARGFGSSSYPPGGHTLVTFTEDLVGLLDHLSCHRVDLVGISLGGIIGLQLALEHPGRVKRMVLINTAARIFPDDLKTTLYYALRLLLVMTVGIDRQAHLVANRLFPQPEEEELRCRLVAQIRAANPRAYRTTMLALARFDVTRRLGALKSPVLVVTGARDSTILPARQAELAAGIPGARQVYIQGAGHAVTVQQPEAVNALILSFLNNGSALDKPS